MEKRKRDNNFLSNAYDQLVSICLLGNDIFSYILSKSTAESRQLLPFWDARLLRERNLSTNRLLEIVN